MTGQYASARVEAFQDMATLALDVGLFTSEFRLCDTITEYLADIVAQSHEDPARYANFSSLLINEIVELAFRSANPVGNIDFNLLKNDACVRVSVAFTQRNNSSLSSGKPDRPSPSGGQLADYDIFSLANAIHVDFHAETKADDRVTLTADFVLREGGH